MSKTDDAMLYARAILSAGGDVYLMRGAGRAPVTLRSYGGNVIYVEFDNVADNIVRLVDFPDDKDSA